MSGVRRRSRTAPLMAVLGSAGSVTVAVKAGRIATATAATATGEIDRGTVRETVREKGSVIEAATKEVAGATIETMAVATGRGRRGEIGEGTMTETGLDRGRAIGIARPTEIAIVV